MAVTQHLLILGTSMLAPEVLDLVDDIGGYSVAACVENLDREKVGTVIRGVPVVWYDDIMSCRESHRCVCALGTTKRRTYIETMKQMGFSFATLVHPSARISRTSVVGEGSIVSVGCIVAANTRIGNHVIMNRGCLVGHDTIVDDYVTLSPGSNVAGVVHIGAAAYIGMGAIILDRMQIGTGAVVGAGSVVTKHVPDNTQVVGVPAKVVKSGIDGR